MQLIIDAILRYHRKHPLRVAFATPVLLARFPVREIDQAYQQLVSKGLVEPVYHTVERNGQEWPCYRVTKEGLAVQAEKEQVQS